MVLGALVGALSQWPDDEDAPGFISRWTMASFGVHLLFGVAIASSAAAISYLGGDALTYNSGALGIMAHWQHGLPLPDLHGGKEGYYYMLAGIYWVFGPDRIAGVAVNAVLAAALVPIVCDTTQRLFGSRAARLTAPMVVLVPGMVLWTSQLLKEAPILFFLAVAANCGVRLVERFRVGPLLVLMATLPALLTFRGPVGVAGMAGIVGGMAIGKRNLAGGFTTALAVGGLIAVALAFGLGSSGYETTVGTNLKQANVIRQDLAVSAQSGFAPSADISTRRGAISYLPRGLLGFTLGPLPWEIRGTRQLVAVPDLLAWYFLIPSLVRGSRAAARLAGRQTLTLALPALTITVLLALVVGNYGTIVRERMQILVLTAPVIALGMSLARSRRAAEPELEAPAVR
jgi:4-amino-4-deoxy-L-arabinose transferase-like glycosyltransferase